MKKIIKLFSLIISVVTFGLGGFYLGSRDQVIEIAPPKKEEPKQTDQKVITQQKTPQIKTATQPKETVKKEEPKQVIETPKEEVPQPTTHVS